MSDAPLFDRLRPDDPEPAPVEAVFRVAELHRAVRGTLERTFGEVWVEGEISDFTRAASGHCYFTLNDSEETAQLRCVMFKLDARRTKATLANGEKVRLRGALSIYEARGAFQLIARLALPAGAGDLHAQFLRTKKKLEDEGLLDAAKKRPLPRFPRVVGVVTSTSGAALHDIVRVASRRFPARIVVSHCLVQGPSAPASIVAALTAIQRLRGVEAVIVGRGGGSAEDLFAFNDEAVARAIAACRVPIVSAVGHETDITIADLVADVRAATPSNAAELVFADLDAVRAELDRGLRALSRAMDAQLDRHRLVLERHARALRDPRRAFAPWRTELAEFVHRLRRAVRAPLVARRDQLRALEARLVRLDARARLARDRAELTRLDARLHAAMPARLARLRAPLGTLAARLEVLSPLKVLARGYAIALHERTGKALVSSTDVERGDEITLRLHDGELRTKVE